MRSGVIVAVASILTGFGWQSAWACSCEPSSAEDMYNRADAVVEGRVADLSSGYVRLAWCYAKELFNRRPEDYETECGVRAELAVTHRWKGTTGEFVLITTGRGGGDCGVPFEEGSSYLLYLVQVKAGMYTTSICMRPQPLEQATEERNALARLTGQQVTP